MRFKVFLEAAALPAVRTWTSIPKEEKAKLATLLNIKSGQPFWMAVNMDSNGFKFGFLRNKDDDNISALLINPVDELVKLPHGYEYDPIKAEVLSVMYQSGLLNNYKVISGEHQLGNIQHVVNSIKRVSGSFPTWAREKYSHRSSQKRFGMHVFKEIWEANWYHATFKKYVADIKKHGLQPSETMNQIVQKYGSKDGSISLGDVPMKGWSNYNPDRQAAVYLYKNKHAATTLAQYLSERNRESTVVLEINGHAIKDYSKIMPDEDAFRDYDGILSKRYKSRIPHFYASILNNYDSSIAYKDTILSKYIKVIEEINYGGYRDADDET